MENKILRETVWCKGSQIVEDRLMPDHVPVCVSIPAKYPVSNVVGYLKVEIVLRIARRFVLTLGLAEAMMSASIQNYEETDARFGRMK